MLIKARMVLTTNYDNFIEERYSSANTKIQRHIGNRGLFEKSDDYGELFKIHGSIDDVNSIVITSKDYADAKERSALIDAKVLSNLTESPIIFLGYSLTDQSIKHLLNSFTKNAPFDISKAASRIGVVEYDKGNMNFKESIENMNDNQFHYTGIRTDNFKKIYDKISEIDQSYTPAEIRKYEASLRRIIAIKGQDKKLKTVLVDYENIDKWTDEEIKHKNIVVAFGNDKIIYRYPTYTEYLRNYFNNKNYFTPEIAVKFIANQPIKTPLPIKKYKPNIKNEIQKSKDDGEINKLSKRLRKYGNLTFQNYIKSLENPKTGKNRIAVSTLNLSILEKSNDPFTIYSVSMKETPKINYLVQNLNKFDKKRVKEFINYLLKKDDKIIKQSFYRKLFMAYSLL